MSVSALNHQMFAAKREASGRSDWVVLSLHPSILWTHNCRFCWRNAAKKEIVDHRGRMDGAWAFDRMFADNGPQRFVGDSYRMETQIPNCLTTSSDAEIQVMEPIAPAHIIAAWVSEAALAPSVQGHLNLLDGPERDVVVQDFAPRFVNGFDQWG